jgi:hypothetical protein
VATLTVQLELKSTPTTSIFQIKSESEVWYPLFSTYLMASFPPGNGYETIIKEGKE